MLGELPTESVTLAGVSGPGDNAGRERCGEGAVDIDDEDMGATPVVDMGYIG
jgi:hypothetical protein